VTAAVAVLVSLLVSFTLTPMMASRMLRRAVGHERGRKAHGWLLRQARPGVRIGACGFCVRHRIVTLVVAARSSRSAVPLYGMLRQDYLPERYRRGRVQRQRERPRGREFRSL
jgi:HAE1 family hydrophobic/amphiphilic exporter-1